jgi:Leucine Rich repeat
LGRSAGLHALRALPRLRALDLSGCSGVCDTAMAAVAELSGLWSLNLSGCREISNDGLRWLERMGALRRLILGGCSITDRGMQSLARMTGAAQRPS